eukprot:16431149-Heterocapsa_arctica.AAC.2
MQLLIVARDWAAQRTSLLRRGCRSPRRMRRRRRRTWQGDLLGHRNAPRTINLLRPHPRWIGA